MVHDRVPMLRAEKKAQVEDNMWFYEKSLQIKRKNDKNLKSGIRLSCENYNCF